MKKEPSHKFMLLSVWGKSLSIVPALCVCGFRKAWILWWDLPLPLCPTCPNHISIFIFAKPYHLFLLSFSNLQIHLTFFFTLFFKFANPYFLFFTFFVPRQIHIYSLEFTPSLDVIRNAPSLLLISFICALKSLC